jgi:diguanylate cyclase (GGDEF)-like protein
MLPSNFSLDGFLYKPPAGISNLTKWIIGALILSLLFASGFATYILKINRNFIRKINNLTYYDGLTGLPNRRMLKEQITILLSRNINDSFNGAILFISLDNFKTINDNFGSDNGNLAIIEIARCIRNCIHTDDTLVRVTDYEFVVLLDTIEGDIQQAAIQTEAIATKIHNIIQKPLDIGGQKYHCTSYIGIHLFQHKTTFEELLKHSDSAMSQAKALGLNKIHFFDAHMQADLEERFQLAILLRKAIPEQLRLYYQVQVNADMLITGAEVLIRWQHPSEGMISPTVFIPIAEETGLILDIGQWVLEAACCQLKAWESHADFCHITLAVNVSAKQFHQDDFVQKVLSVLEKTQANPVKLKLELTEGMLLQGPKNVTVKMNALKSSGVHFALDDFGTGYSSLAYLKNLPLDQLKIDQSFVKDIPDNPQSCSIVLSIIALGKGLGLNVIAEGVENNSQRTFLSQSGCSSYQGYLFGKPLPVKDFEQLAMDMIIQGRQSDCNL